MNNTKKVVTVLSFVFLFVLISIINNWITRQIDEVSTKPQVMQKRIVKPQATDIVSKAVLPTIDPQNDPLAPIVKKAKPVSVKPVEEEKDRVNKRPKKKYEFATDEVNLML